MAPTDDHDAVRVYRRVMQLQRRLTRLIDAAFVAGLGRSTTDLLVLRSTILGFTAPSSITRRLGFQAPTVARSLAALQTAGFVTVTDDPDDRRRRIAQPTQAGHELDARAAALVATAFAEHFPHADPHTLRQAATALDALWTCIGSADGYPDDPERPAAA